MKHIRFIKIQTLVFFYFRSKAMGSDRNTNRHTFCCHYSILHLMSIFGWSAFPRSIFKTQNWWSNVFTVEFCELSPKRPLLASNIELFVSAPAVFSCKYFYLWYLYYLHNVCILTIFHVLLIDLLFPWVQWVVFICSQ